MVAPADTLAEHVHRIARLIRDPATAALDAVARAIPAALAESGPALALRGERLRRRGDAEGAARLLAAGIERAPTLLGAYHALALARIRAGDRAGARAAWLALLERDPDDATARYQVALAFHEDGDRVQAARWYEAQVACHPSSPRAWHKVDATPQVKISGSAQLQGIQTLDVAGQPLLSFDSLQVALNEVQPLRRIVDIAAIDWSGVHVHIGRDAKGALTLPGVNQPVDDASVKTPPSAGVQESPWQVRLARLGVHDATVDWVDAGLPGGTAVWKAENLQLQASAIELPFKPPLQFRASARLSGGGAKGDPAWVALRGQATDAEAQAAASIRGFPLAMAAPYLAAVLKPALGGMLDADIGLARNGAVLVAQVATLSLDNLVLTCAAEDKCPSLRRAGIADAGKTSVAELGRLEVTDALVMLPEQRATVGRLLLHQPRMLLSRGPKGDWMFEQWLAQAPEQQPNHAAPKKVEAPWALKLAALDVDEPSKDQQLP